MLRGKHLTEEGCNIVMVFSNIILAYSNLEFRFPKGLPTFVSRMQFPKKNTTPGITKLISCGDCHATYTIHPDNNDRKKHSQCTFTKSYSTNTGLPLKKYENNLYETSKSRKLIPRYVFVYNSVISTLKTFFKRNGYMESTKSWRSKKLQEEGRLFDIMDGNVWKNFKAYRSDAKPFVKNSDSNILFSLNADWYQPFSKGSHSVGVLSMTILNLDRRTRNLRKNVIPVSFMPGPHEAGLSEINNYMDPLVEELNTLLNGVVIS